MIIKSSEFNWEKLPEYGNHVIIHGNTLKDMSIIPDDSVQCTVTSPPYFNLRNYTTLDEQYKDDEIGRELDVTEYLDKLYSIFKEIYRITRKDGSFFLNIADTYAVGHMNGKVGKGAKKGMDKLQERYGVLFARRKPEGCKKKDLIGIPWLCAFMLREMGWYLRSEIIWSKTFCMTEPQAKDRPWKSHEKIFLLSKSEKYKHNQLMNPNGSPMKDVWTIKPSSSQEGHPAPMATELISNCILAGSDPGDIVFDPFGGINTVGVYSKILGRKSIVMELIERNCLKGEYLLDKTKYENLSQQELFNEDTQSQ